MKNRTLKIIMIALAALAAAVLAFHIAAVCVVSTEIEDEKNGIAVLWRAEERLFGLDISEVCSKMAYKIFGVITEPGVCEGGGYLFPSGAEPFDYKADAEGKLSFTDEECAAFLAELNARRSAHEADGADFYVFVIPNSQTVLRDKAPFGDPEAETRAQKLKDYLAESGFDEFYLLSDALSDAGYEVFHNTENAINSYGAYLCFKYITSLMPDQLNRRMNEIDLASEDISVITTDGRALAKQAKLEKMIKNRTVCCDTSKLEGSYVTEISGALTLCALKDGYNGFIGSSCVLIESYASYEKSLMAPYFSAAYTDTGYKNDLSYSNAAEKELSPSAVICLVREDALEDLLRSYDSRTYASRLGGFSGVTAAPEVVCTAPMTEGTVLIAGKCGGDSEICAYVGEDRFTVSGSCGRFLIQIPVGAEKTEVRLTAARPNCRESDAVYVYVDPPQTANADVFVGKSSMLYYSQTVRDYTGANLYTQQRLTAVISRAEKKRDEIRAASGKNTTVIILSAPDPLTVYPEAASDAHYAKRAKTTRLDQLKSAFSDVEGVVFLDIRAEMKHNTDVGKLYYQTDTHWTELGAYFGYRALTEEIAKDFPAAAPYQTSAFRLDTVEAAAGDLASFLGMRGFTENIDLISPLFPYKAQGAPDKPDTIDRSVYAPSFTSTCPGEGLPSAVMIRDSYSANLFPLICEHFKTLYVQDMWRSDPDLDKIAETGADFVIIVCSERNIDEYLK